jgi:hypothetical protein
MSFKFDLRSSVIANDRLFYQVFRYVQLKSETPLQYKVTVEKSRKNLITEIKRNMQLTIDCLMNELKQGSYAPTWIK